VSALIQFLRSLDYAEILRAVVDIAVVAYMLYRLILLAKGRRAWQILIGIGVFFAFLLASEVLGLVTLNWILRQVTPLGPVAIVILLYPELREVLERLGRLDFWGAPIHVTSREDMAATIEEVVSTARLLAPRKTGALMVLERETGLDDVIATGTVLDAELSAGLLCTIFYHGTPLHDGAVIIRGGRVVAAECRLPLSESPNIASNVHMRHRAAIGISENSDAVVVIVSEETGTISLAINGKLVRGLSEDKLRSRLSEAFGRSIGGKELRGAMNAALPFVGRLADAANGRAAGDGKARRPSRPSRRPAPGPPQPGQEPRKQ
jgi:diadenylate cyclase